jgi:adenylate cyclase
VIPLLNDYADVIVSAIHAQGGDVLKLIGDGILGIFAAADRARACAAALAAATTGTEIAENRRPFPLAIRCSRSLNGRAEFSTGR